MKVSVLTLVRGREKQLRHVLTSLARQTRPPDEVVIAYMQEAPYEDLPDPGCPVRPVFIPGDPMPLAAARNAAATAASGEALIFLDVDCIAGPGLVAAYLAALEQHPALYLGEVFYLPEMPLHGIDYALFDEVGEPHPARPEMPARGVRREPDAGQLWGLSFALLRRTWMAVGGMDSAFVGYGGEETDFAVRLAQQDTQFYWVAGARAYHQHHPVHIPPLHHFEPIVRNAAQFYARHGRWCMEYWLDQFSRAGLIEWCPDAAKLHVLRAPTWSEIQASRQSGVVRYS